METKDLRKILIDHGQSIIDAEHNRPSWSLEGIANETIQKLEAKKEIIDSKESKTRSDDVLVAQDLRERKTQIKSQFLNTLENNVPIRGGVEVDWNELYRIGSFPFHELADFMIHRIALIESTFDKHFEKFHND